VVLIITFLPPGTTSSPNIPPFFKGWQKETAVLERKDAAAKTGEAEKISNF
jgi:hypothetical protein